MPPSENMKLLYVFHEYCPMRYLCHFQVQNFRAATELDQYLAIAYFQAGVSNFLLGEFQQALEDFEDAFQFLRGNEAMYVIGPNSFRVVY
jgi:tetratricopeptide (TPR) repeat protein